MVNFFNGFLEKNPKLLKFLVFLFDNLSKVTYFVLYNRFVFILTIIFLFYVPVIFSNEFINFLIIIYKTPILSYQEFFKLPGALQLLIAYFILLLEIVFICTFLAVVPLIKQEMTNKYNDSLILKKRGYNMYSSTLRRATTLGFPLAAGIIVGGDVYMHQLNIEAIQKANDKVKVWEAYLETKDKRLLEHIQKIPTNSITTKIKEVGLDVSNKFVFWKSGSVTKD